MPVLIKKKSPRNPLAPPAAVATHTTPAPLAAHVPRDIAGLARVAPAGAVAVALARAYFCGGLSGTRRGARTIQTIQTTVRPIIRRVRIRRVLIHLPTIVAARNHNHVKLGLHAQTLEIPRLIRGGIRWAHIVIVRIIQRHIPAVVQSIKYQGVQIYHRVLHSLQYL